MNIKNKNSSRSPLISLKNISIQYRLPIITSTLLLIIMVIFAGASYYGIRQNNLELGYERLDVISNQFASSLSISNQRNSSALYELAQHEEIKKYLLNKESKSTEKLTEVLNNNIIPGDSLLILVQLLDKDKNPVFTSLEKTKINIKPDSILLIAGQKPFVAIGKFQAINDSIIWPLAAAVVEKNEIIGYVFRLKLLKVSPATLKTFAELLGANTRFHFVNDDRSLWTDLFTVVPPPSYKIPDNEIVEYTNSEGEEVIAKISDIKGSPWSISIERSKEAALTTATRFLEIISAFGVVLLIAGIFLAWVMSRNITEPLNKFSDAASDISAGDYSHLVDIKQKDELGALARSFNTMVVKVRDSQLELESKIKNRTAELKKANENLEELNEKLKELDKLKTNFFTNVSHELRTPLALIMGPVEKLLSQKDLSKNEEKDLRIIQQNARILLKQVNNLLDLSKLEVGKMELEYSDIDLANLVRVIASYFEAMAIEKKITLKINLPETLPIQADADKIERVLINLLSNAFKFTPENGTIECGLSLDNSDVMFFVKDSGPGVKPEFQKEIFVKYKKADKGLIRHLGSTGLGLSIVKEFIELHKGSISVKNNEKAGATFSFKIPVNAPAGTILHGRMIINETEIKDVVESYEILRIDNNNKKLIYNLKPSEKLLPIKGLPTILVIEDNHDMNSFICQTLSSSFNVISAYDGEDGYAKVVKNKPDLIITDIMMPRLSGDMVVSKIKANPDMETIPIIVLSAKSDEDLKIELLRQGVQDYLNKPFTIEELKARVNNIIKMKLVKDRLQSELKSHSEDLSTLVEELSERKNLIELSLLEKEVLLKEIHHRVKNNLQVISSLLNLQSNSINDPESFEIFRESQNRIKSMALIHEKLYKSKNLLQINLEEYINDLISNVYQSYFGGSNHLPLKLKVKDIYLSVDTAISIGLIINELISNALKHAFNDNEVPNGEIEVHLNNEVQNIYCLIVKDNGRGIPDNFNFKDPKTLGLRLVNSLVHQLDGEIQVINNGGAEFKITFHTKDNGLSN